MVTTSDSLPAINRLDLDVVMPLLLDEVDTAGQERQVRTMRAESACAIGSNTYCHLATVRAV